MHKLTEVVPAVPGSASYGSIPFEGLTIPVVLVSGERPGPVVTVVGLQHAGEFSGPGVLDAFLASGVPTGLCGTIVILPLANPLNYSASLDQQVPHPGGTDTNMNRQWPGDAASANRLSRATALLWDMAVCGADALVDFHCCRLSDPWFAACLAGHQPSLGLALAMGLDAVDIQAPSTYAPNLLFMEAAERLDIPSVLVESSPGGFQPRHSIGICEEALRKALVHLGVLNDAQPARLRDPAQPVVFSRSDASAELRVARGGFLGIRRWPGEPVSRGDCIGEVRSAATFEVVERLLSPINGAVACVGDPAGSGFVKPGVLAAVVKPIHSQLRS